MKGGEIHRRREIKKRGREDAWKEHEIRKAVSERGERES